jgi:hypothetical protein
MRRLLLVFVVMAVMVVMAAVMAVPAFADAVPLYPHDCTGYATSRAVPLGGPLAEGGDNGAAQQLRRENNQSICYQGG